MTKSHCDICHRDVSGTCHLAHKTTDARICRECEAKINLHSPKDFVRTK